MIGNWQNYRLPFAPMQEFLRHEPFPSDELKATYIDGMGKPTKRDKRAHYNALLKAREKREKEV